jgi:hypothetical protein
MSTSFGKMSALLLVVAVVALVYWSMSGRPAMANSMNSMNAMSASMNAMSWRNTPIRTPPITLMKVIMIPATASPLTKPWRSPASC